MNQRREEELSRLSTENVKQKQLLVSEFRNAQEMLKEKINEYEIE